MYGVFDLLRLRQRETPDLDSVPTQLIVSCRHILCHRKNMPAFSTYVAEGSVVDKVVLALAAAENIRRRQPDMQHAAATKLRVLIK